jgi:hypothetical protein
MAINIQEILHPSDSSQIKWEKVNYNFDQILANGGGPIGQKGLKGNPGSVGQTGAKGQKGAQGLKGETGTTTSRWETIAINPSNDVNPEYVILKPKLENDNYHPIIFLGDQTYDNVNGNNGQLDLRSTLVIGKHAQGGSNFSDELVTFWHGQVSGTNDNVGITLVSEEDVDNNGDPFVRYKLAETFGPTNTAQTVEFSLGTDKFSIGNDGFGTDAYFIGANSTFKLPESIIGSPEAGMIRYYANQFWGAVADGIGNTTWTPFCMSPCGGGGFSGTITLDPVDDIVVNYDGSLYGNSIEITNGEDVEVDVNGDPWTGAVATTTNATSATTNSTAATTVAQTIEFDGLSWDPSSGVSSDAASGSFLYLIDGVAGQLLNSSLVSAPSWLTFNTYSGGANNNRAEFTVSENTGTNQRTGTITITHPGNSNVTENVGIIQVGANATTQATAATTQATSATTQATAATTQATAATTQATAATTLPEYTVGMANLSVANGLEGTSAQYTWAENGPGVVTFNPSSLVEGTHTYSLVLNIPSGYSNAGEQLIVQDTAVGSPQYKISYDANGGTGSGIGSGNTGGAGLTVANNPFTRTGYTFDVWNTSYMGTGTSYNPGATPPTSAFTGSDGIYDELQLYARWSANMTPATTQSSSGSGSGSGTLAMNHTVQNSSYISGSIMYRNGFGIMMTTTVSPYQTQYICAVPGTITGSSGTYVPPQLLITNLSTLCSGN